MRRTLAQLYITLTELFGEGNKFFDSFKGSFSFPFLLEIEKNSKQFNYLLDIRDFRGSPEFGVYKLLEPQDTYNKNKLYQPFTEEFSHEKINSLIVYLYFCIQRAFDEISKNYYQPFFKRVDSSNILYGYSINDEQQLVANDER